MWRNGWVPRTASVKSFGAGGKEQTNRTFLCRIHTEEDPQPAPVDCRTWQAQPPMGPQALGHPGHLGQEGGNEKDRGGCHRAAMALPVLFLRTQHHVVLLGPHRLQ